jgi:hypothetical protein
VCWTCDHPGATERDYTELTLTESPSTVVRAAAR